MGMFNCLIDKENKSPKEGMEYIYNLDMVWKNGSFESYPIEEGTIVNNVKKLENNSYEFTVKETGEEFSCTYGWAFWENTPENLVKIKIYNHQNEIYKEAEKSRLRSLDQIEKLH